MITKTSVTSIIPRKARFTYHEILWQATLVKSRLLKAYADWRVGATLAEKHAYKASPSILLTFDDYGSPEQIARLLDILRKEDVKAMFFLQGNWADRHPDLVSAIARAGHIVGNHTYTHPDLSSFGDNEVRAEIATGLPGPWLRPPRGRYNDRIRNIASSLGYRICYWTIDSDDWQGIAGDLIRAKVLAGLSPGAVILFHAHASETIAVLPSLIADIRARGFTLTNMQEPDWEPLS